LTAEPRLTGSAAATLVPVLNNQTCFAGRATPAALAGCEQPSDTCYRCGVPDDLKSFDASRPDFAPYGFTCERWQPERMARANRHNEIELNYLDEGSITYLLGGRRMSVRSGRLAAFWAAIPHQIIAIESRTPYFVATIPLAWFLQCRLPGNFVGKLLRGEAVDEPDQARAVLDTALFPSWTNDLERGDAEQKRAALLEVEARLLRLAARVGSSRARPAPLDIGAAIPERVEKMATFLATNYTEKLTVQEIADAAGLHPNYAMGVFRKTFGTTLIEYLTQMRISHAQRLLATSETKILEVALSSGFSSLSRFNAVFSRICGEPPSEYRQRHRV